MFSKPRPNETVPQPAATPAVTEPGSDVRQLPAASSQPKPKPAASVLSSDITIVGNVRSSGDIQVEGSIEGDIRAQMLIVGETATVKGEVMAEDVVVHGRVVGRLRGLKVRLSSTARVEGDIIHKTIAIESGAHFEGSVQRHDDPLSKGQPSQPARIAGPATQPQRVPQPAE